MADELNRAMRDMIAASYHGLKLEDMAPEHRFAVEASFYGGAMIVLNVVATNDPKRLADLFNESMEFRDNAVEHFEGLGVYGGAVN